MNIPTLIIFLAAAAPSAPSRQNQLEGGVITVARGQYTLNAADVTVASIAAEFANKVGIPVRVDPKVATKRVSINLSPRPADRFFMALARRIGARAHVNHVIRREPARVAPTETKPAFAMRVIDLRTNGRIPLEDAVREIDAEVRVEEPLDGRVSILSPGLPLYRVLNSMARQLGASWHTELRVEYRPIVDSAAESYERERDHFSDLARLTQKELRAEIGANLDDLARLPVKQRDRGIDQNASDIMSLPEIFRQIPGEHRETLEFKVKGILRAYRDELGARSGTHFNMLREALDSAEAKLTLVR